MYLIYPFLNMFVENSIFGILASEKAKYNMMCRNAVEHILDLSLAIISGHNNPRTTKT